MKKKKFGKSFHKIRLIQLLTKQKKKSLKSESSYGYNKVSIKI